MKPRLCIISTPTVSNIPERRTFVSHSRHLKASVELTSDLWCIGVNKEKSTLEATTQQGTGSALLPLRRRYQADRVYNLNRINGRFAIDTLFSDINSLNKTVCAQLFGLKVGLSATYPIQAASGDTIGQSYKDFCHDYCVPNHLTFYGAIAQICKNTQFMKTMNKYGTRYHVSSPRRPNDNPTERVIRKMKKVWHIILLKNKVPSRLWDYGLIWICETGNLSVSSSQYVSGRTPLE